jgi:hypothetical protein
MCGLSGRDTRMCGDGGECVSCVGLVVEIPVHMCAHTATFVSTYHLICMLVLIPAHMQYACSYHDVRPEAATDAASCVCCYIRSTTPTSSSTESVLKEPQYSLNRASLEPCKCLKRALIALLISSGRSAAARAPLMHVYAQHLLCMYERSTTRTCCSTQRHTTDTLQSSRPSGTHLPKQ